jgi:hypothetical protein
LFAGRHRREAPVFKVFAELAIPNITIHPPVDEVQIYLSKVVQTIISVSKNVSQWNKEKQGVSNIIVLTGSPEFRHYDLCHCHVRID